jgi:hypothetical protein
MNNERKGKGRWKERGKKKGAKRGNLKLLM